MSYSIGWPTGFKSRTGNPSDPCFIGSIGGEKNKRKAQRGGKFDYGTKAAREQRRIYVEAQRQVPFRFLKASKARKVYLHLKTVPSATTSELCALMGCTKQEISGYLASAIKAGVIQRRDGRPGRHAPVDAVYSIGAVVPRGEA